MAQSTHRAALALAVVVLAAANWAAAPDEARSSSASCRAGYAYAGVAGRQPAHGLAATISAAAVPAVTAGHVAAWVGLGGRQLGPGGTSAWIQAGLSRAAGGRASVYTEITRPGSEPVYSAIAPVRGTVPYRISVLMESGERWIVRVNGRLVAGPVHLRGSASWRPVATAESWLPRAAPCNAFSYRFGDVTEQGQGRSAWKPLVDVDVVRRGGHYTVARNGSSFLAASD